MGKRRIGRLALLCAWLIGLVTGCAPATPLATTQTDFSAVPLATQSRSYQVFSFTGRNGDGNQPQVGLAQGPAGKLLGTTMSGGNQCWGSVQCGKIFAIQANGAKTSYDLSGDQYGAIPSCSLPEFNGLWYGEARTGGNTPCGRGCGTIYSMDASGKRHLVYAFKGGNDGFKPNGGLTILNGVFYGTTLQEGAWLYGTLFSVTPSGQEHVLHRSRASLTTPHGATSRLLDRKGVL